MIHTHSCTHTHTERERERERAIRSKEVYTTTTTTKLEYKKKQAKMAAPSSDDTEKLIMLASIRQACTLWPGGGHLFETYDVDASGSGDEIRTMIKIASAMK